MCSDRIPGHRQHARSLLVALSLLAGAAGQSFAGTEALPGIEPIFVPPFVPVPDDLSGGNVSGTSVEQTGILGAGGGTIVSAINQGTVFCGGVPVAYQASCMADQLETISESLPDDAGYDEMRQVLADASRSIEAVATSNRDRSQPRITATSARDPAIATSRPLTPVREAAIVAVNEEAAQILEDAGGLLLRSSSRSQELAEQYQTVAQALDSSALLLRSRPATTISPRPFAP